MLKYSKTNLKKLEQFLEDQSYQLIYEKGHFNSGYCIVNQSKVIVVNKFYDTEGRINVLLEIIPQLELNEGLFNEKSRKLFQQVSELTNHTS
jgi:hypothetical protein